MECFILFLLVELGGIFLDNQQIMAEHPNIKKGAIMFALLMAGFIGLFSETALNMAFTNIMTEYGIGAAEVQWLTTGYLLTLGIFLPVTALLIQWFTTRQLFLGSVLLSLFGTLFGALAPGFAWLLVARVIQALGTGLLLPLMTNVILLIIPIHKRGSAMGLVSLVILLAPAVGPTFSGFLIEAMHWKLIFWVCLILLLIPLLVGMKYVENISVITRPKIDVLSIVLSTIGFGGLVFGFSSAEGGLESWAEPRVWLTLIIGFIGLALFIIRQLKLEKPVLNIRVLKHPMFVLGILLAFICMFVILGTAVLLPIYLKSALLLSALVAGLVLLPGGLINGLMSLVTGRLFDLFGPKWLVLFGTLGMSIVSFVFFFVISTETPVWLIVILHICLLVCIALVIMPAQTNGLNQLPKQMYPDGTAIMNTLQQIAGAMGTALAISTMTAGQMKYMQTVENPDAPAVIMEALAAGVKSSFFFVFVFAVIAFIVSLFIKRVSIQ